ncbi:MAG: hypothetical protein VW390_12465, partial [Gammaproteobacteria bacterium]
AGASMFSGRSLSSLISLCLGVATGGPPLAREPLAGTSALGTAIIAALAKPRFKSALRLMPDE